jgi:hypothetical protein
MPQDRKQALTFIMSILLIVVLLTWTGWRWYIRQDLVVEEQPVEVYVIFNELMHGTTSRAAIGSTAIISLPETKYVLPITVVTKEGTSIPVTTEQYEDRIAGSFIVPDQESLIVSVKAVSASTDYMITLIPYQP